MHFVVCIICIAATLILNEGEPASSVNDIRVDFEVAWIQLTDDWPRFVELGCRNGRADHSCGHSCQILLFQEEGKDVGRDQEIGGS